MSTELDAVYRERNAVVAALIHTNGWRAWRAKAPDAPGWTIVYAETPAGQVSWHVSADDSVALFGDLPWAGADNNRWEPWDGHSTEEKYRRLAALGWEGPDY